MSNYLYSVKMWWNGIAIRKSFFDVLESAAFIIPAIPDSLTVRFGILSFYFALHYFKAQNVYARIKNQIIYMDSTDKKEDIEDNSSE